MVLVKYASRCDVTVYESLTDPSRGSACGKRSVEYTEWPTCRVCNDHVCADHEVPYTHRAGEGERPETCLCPPCAWKHRGENL